MKIRQLHINRFGHFNECDVVFSGDGLQVIYGPNEAGKTTLLEFLRGLLFDFPARTPYDFGGQGEMAGVATLELRDGRTVELRRRKGNKDKVAIKLDGQPTKLGDADWSQLLGNADRGLFESVFAFGLDQLSQGESSLKHESLQSALFGGSIGGTSSPDKVIVELSSQAESLFKKGGSKPVINARLAEMKLLSREMKDLSLRPEKYHETDEAVTKAANHAKTLHDHVDMLRRNHSKVEKRVRAWPKWWELCERNNERKGLSTPKHIPVDARQRYLTITKELKEITEDQAKRSKEVEQAESSLAALKLDPDAVSYRTEIKACLELRQSFVEARNDLPERRQQREATRRQIELELSELRPGWGHDDLRAFSVDVATQREIERLIEERREHTTSYTKLSAKRDGDAANLELAREGLAEIGSPPDVAALAGVLADEPEFTANRKQSENIQDELAKLERKLLTQCRKLTPPLPAGTPLPQELPVPRIETITEFETEFDEVCEKWRAACASVEEDEVQHREIEKSLSSATSSHVIPSLDERDAARERRDVGWSLVRRKYISSEQADSAVAAWLDGDAAASLPDGYEQAVRRADGIADLIYDNAKEVAEREELRRQLAVIAKRLDQKRQRIADLKQQQTELQTKWQTLWEPCGFAPLAPVAMRSWLSDHESACTIVARQDELTGELSQLGKRIASFEQRLRATCGGSGDDVSGLLASARDSVDAAKDQLRRSADLQKEVRRLDKQLVKHDADLQNLATRETTANAEWQTVLNRLNLPADWGTELAREVINKLNATRIRLDGLPGEDVRIDAMQTRIEEFGQRVRSLCEAIGHDLLHDPSELAVKKLDEQLERAVEAQRKHDAFSQKLIDVHKQLGLLNERRERCDSEREHLFELAEATTEAEFLEVVTCAEKVVRLENEIEQLKRDVDLIRAGDDRDEFEQSLSTSELVVLQGQERDLSEDLKTAETSRKAADGDEALARKALMQLDGSDKVATLSEELSRKRSLLGTEVDRYMPLIYAKHLLNAAVIRFEKDNQPEMIATVSRLFDQMTGGKYVEFDRTGGGKQGILVRRADGVERTSDQLSTGTREQLYLAIRLAYVLHYCKQNQPLPIVIDDVLANFDDVRTRQTLTALADISQSTQVLFFTCHPHMVTLAREVVPGLIPLEVPAIPGK